MQVGSNIYTIIEHAVIVIQCKDRNERKLTNLDVDREEGELQSQLQS